jgi:hypothetical protein
MSLENKTEEKKYVYISKFINKIFKVIDHETSDYVYFSKLKGEPTINNKGEKVTE